MRHRRLIVLLGGFNTLPGILAAAEDVPARDDLEAFFAEVAGEGVGVVAFGAARFERNFGMNAPAAARKASRSIRIGLSSLDGRIIRERHGQHMIFCARQPGKPGWAAKIVGLDANNLAKLGARVFQAPPEFRQRNLSCVNAFVGLLEVALTSTATLEALLHVAQNLRCAATFSWASATRRV